MQYKILRTVGEETPRGNEAIERLTAQVSSHLADGWSLAGGVSVSSIVGPKTKGSTRDNWFTSFSQAVWRESAKTHPQ